MIIEKESESGTISIVNLHLVEKYTILIGQSQKLHYDRL